MHHPSLHNSDLANAPRDYRRDGDTAAAPLTETNAAAAHDPRDILLATGCVPADATAATFAATASTNFEAPGAIEAVPIAGDAAAVWKLLITEGRLAVSVVDAMGVYRYLSPRLLEISGKKAEYFLDRSVTTAMDSSAGVERLIFIRQAITAAKPLLLVESLSGVPLRTIIQRAVAPTGELLALCVHHIGAAAMELPLDAERYTIITPVNHEITPLSKLSDREIEVLRMIAMGDSQAEIAAKIHRTVKTVEWHRASLGRKLGATSRVELARLAIRYGLVTTEFASASLASTRLTSAPPESAPTASAPPASTPLASAPPESVPPESPSQSDQSRLD